ncbi:hypothetical protein Sliba_38480 [Streptomyces nigrescens]|uniref:Uncharacterized protein n=1 Tax=Streptomyces nigrescens TaxID=1920 RepID=A0A640TN01_STRNI|nr:hypothetical protein Sliba_38480 [Streptomyces libani subsp. libani]GGV92894.1 hypothetical protein GCM10010500_27170 [Streptomyces libani subsp. libani]
MFRNATVRKTPAIGTLTRQRGAQDRKPEELPRPRTAERGCAGGVRQRTQLRRDEVHLGCFGGRELFGERRRAGSRLRRPPVVGHRRSVAAAVAYQSLFDEEEDEPLALRTR